MAFILVVIGLFWTLCGVFGLAELAERVEGLNNLVSILID